MMITNDLEAERETLDQLADKRAWQLERLDKIQSQLKERVIEAYRDGESIQSLAKRAGVSRVTVYSWVGE
jgi:transposase-like protein